MKNYHLDIHQTVPGNYLYTATREKLWPSRFAVAILKTRFSVLAAYSSPCQHSTTKLDCSKPMTSNSVAFGRNPSTKYIHYLFIILYQSKKVQHLKLIILQFFKFLRSRMKYLFLRRIQSKSMRISRPYHKLFQRINGRGCITHCINLNA